jgi:hypothetical protein
METIWARFIPRIMFIKTNVRILGIMLLSMETHKCVPIVMKSGLAIWMITNPNHVMFSYWEIMILIEIVKSKPILLCH